MEIIESGAKVERFEAAFNQIHIKLKQLVNDHREFTPFSDVIYAARNKHNVVRYNYDKLKKFGHLRNAIVHNKTEENFYIADPHEEIVQEIEEIRDMIFEPPLALSIASQPVQVITPDTSLKDILNEIEKKEYSQFPIYDLTGFKGLLTEGGIAKWFSRHLIGDLLSIENITAADILQLESVHNVAFLERAGSIYDLETIFEESFDRNEKLEAILITQHGLKTEKPIGIVTSWDLVRIDHTTLTLSSHV